MADVTPGSEGIYPDAGELRSSGGLAKFVVDWNSRRVEDGSLYFSYAVDTEVASEASFIVNFDNADLPEANTAYVNCQVFSDQPMTLAVAEIDGHTASTDTYALRNMNGFAALGTAHMTLRAAPTTSTATTYSTTALFSITVPSTLGHWEISDLIPGGRFGMAATKSYTLTVTNAGTAAGYVSTAVVLEEK